MEGSEYGSAHLPSPALVVFSQAANGLGEALRIQRPFHSQIQDAKDLHHLSLVGSYGAHLLHSFPPHFLHPSANAAGSPFSSGGAFVKPFPSNLPLPSAFAPPSKCVGLGLEQGMLFSGNESFRTDSSSPVCTSLSPPVKEESLEGHTSEEGDRDRICSPERSPEASGFRPPKSNGAEPLNLHMDTTGHSLYRFPFYNSFKNLHQHQAALKKTTSIGTPPPNSCPVCGIHLSANELETHFLAELDRLYKLSSGPERQRIRNSFNLAPGIHPTNGLMQSPDNRWETFQRIRTNRQGRLRAKTRKRKGDSESDFTEHIRNAQCQSCPVCHSRLQRTPEEIAQHVEECLQKTGASSHSQSRSEEEDETVDVESYGDETSNCAVNLASQNNNNNNNNNNNSSSNNNNSSSSNNNNNTIESKIDASPRSHHPFSAEEHMITSRSSLWQTPSSKHPPSHHRIGSSPNLHHSLTCGPPMVSTQVPPPPPPTGSIFPNSNESTGATPTSSDQIIDDTSSGLRCSTQHPSMGGNTSIETDDDVIVDNSNDDDIKKSLKDNKRIEKNSVEEAVSSMEIDSSATDMNGSAIGNHKSMITSPDSYVSTSDPAEPTSRAQVLEELRARIRELEGTQLKMRPNHDEEHYKCYLCKDSKKPCPQCKMVTSSNELRKIHV